MNNKERYRRFAKSAAHYAAAYIPLKDFDNEDKLLWLRIMGLMETWEMRRHNIL